MLNTIGYHPYICMVDDYTDAKQESMDDHTDARGEPMDNHTDAEDAGMTRRQTLAALGAGAGTLAGVGVFSDTVAAWDRFDVCFDGCQEVSMVVSESDIDHGGSNDLPAVAKVIVSTGSGLECRTVEFTSENATKKPAMFGDYPVVQYAVPGDEKILGVLEYNYSPDPDAQFDDPVWCVNANRNECATYCDGDMVEYEEDLSDAPCVPDSYDAGYAGSSNICPPSTICPDGYENRQDCTDESGDDTTDGDDGGDGDDGYNYGNGETLVTNEQNCNGSGGGENENEDENENEGGSGGDYTYTYTYEYTYTKGDYQLEYLYEYEWSEDAKQDPNPPAPTVDESLPCSEDGAGIGPNPDPSPSP